MAITQERATAWARTAWKRYAIKPPADVESLARKLKIKIHYKDLPLPLAGISFKTETSRHFIINRRHPLYRRRFTIAHEIGHVLMSEEALHFRIIRDCDTEEEKACDAFAAELLLPDWWVIGMYYAYRHVARDAVDIISGMALASKTAVTIRLRELGLKA